MNKTKVYCSKCIWVDTCDFREDAETDCADFSSIDDDIDTRWDSERDSYRAAWEEYIDYN